MASQDAELQLKVSLDLAFFRQQLTGLGQSAAGYSVPIFIKFDRQTIANEYRLLSRYIGGKDFRVKIQSNLEEEVNRAKTLAKAIGELRQTGQGQEGTLPIGIGGIASIKPKEARKIRTALRRSILSEGGKILIPTSIVAAITQVDVAAFKKAVTEKLSGIKVKVGVENGGFAETEQGKAGLMKFMREQGLLGKTASGMTMRMGKNDGDLSQQLGDAVKSAEKIKSIFDGVAKSIATTGKSVANIQGKRLGLGNVPLMARSLEGKGGRSAAAISGVSSSSALRALYPEVNRTIASLAILRSQVEQNTRKLSGFGLIIGLAAFAGVPLAKSIVKLTGSADNFAELLDSIGVKLQSAFDKAASNILNASSSRLLSGGSLAGLLPAAYRGIGPAAGPAGLLSGRGGPAGLLPPAYRGIGASPNAGALPPAYRGLPSGPIEVQVKELFNPSKLNFLPPGKSGGALEGVLRMMTEDAKAKQAKIDQSIDDLIASIEAASKAMQAIAQSGRVRVVDLGRSTQAALPLGLNAGLLSAGAAQAPAPLPSAVANLAPAQVFPARQRRTRTQADMRGIRSMLPPAQDVTQDGGTEKAIRSFVESIYRQKIKIEKFFAENFSANSQLPQSTRKLAAAMDSAASSLRVLTGTKAFGALPTRDMVDITRFKQAMVAAIRADMDNALRQQMGGRLLPEAGNTGRQAYLRQSMEGMGAFSAPTVGFERIKRTPEQLRQDLFAKREAQARERSALREKDVRSESIQKLLPSAMAIDLGGGKRESLINAFYESLRNTQQILNRYFSANSYLPRATRQLTVAMQQAAQGMKALPGARGTIAALPTKEMVDRTRFQQAIKTAIRTDLDNALKAANSKLYLPAAGQTSYRNPEQIAQQAAQKSPLDIAARTAREQSGQMIRQMRSNMRIPLLPAGRIGETAQSVPAGSERNVSGFKQSIKSLAQQAQDAARAITSQVIPSLKLLQITASSAKGKSSFAWMPQGASNAPRQAQPRTTGPQPPANYSWFHSRAPFVPGPMMGSTGQQWSGAGTQRGVAPPPPPAPPGPLPPPSPPSPPSPPQPPAGGAGGFGGMAAFGRAMGGIQLPGTGVIRDIGSEFAMAAKQVLLFGTAYKALAFLTSFPAQVGEAVASLQSFRNTLREITPSAEEFSASNKFILSLVDQYNIPLQSARDGFAKLYASMQPAGFSGKEIRGLFEGISMGAATFGMSADKVDRVMYAFAQMASKGQVMAEELKGQLGDVLPGALALFARAAKMSMTDFGKAMEDGAFKGNAMRQLLINVGATMKEEFGKGAVGAALTYQGVLNRLQTTTVLFYETFEPLAVAFANTFVLPLTNGIRIVTDAFRQLTTGQAALTQGGGELAVKMQTLVPTLSGIGENIKMAANAAVNLAKAFAPVVQLFLQLISTPIVGVLAQVYTSVILLNGAFTLLGGRILLNLIGNLIQTVVQMTALNVASVTTTSSLTGTRISLGLLASGFATTGAAAVSFAAVLKTAMMTTVVGAIATAVAFGVSEFMRLRGVMDSVAGRYKSIGDQARLMGESGNVSGVQRLTKNLQDQANSYEEIAAGLNRAKKGGGIEKFFAENFYVKIDKATQDLLKRTGLGGYDSAGTGVLTNEDANNIKAAINSNRQETKKTRQILIEQEAKAAAEAEKIDATLRKQSIVPGQGDADKAAEKARREAEKLASQNQKLSIDAASRQNALDKTRFEGLASLTDEQYQHELALIDSRNAYELTGRNSIEARQTKFQQDLLQIELRRIDAVRKAQADVQKAQLDVTMATRAAQAAQSNEVSFMPGRRPGSVSPARGSSFQGFPVTSLPGESRAYRNGTHEGYDFGTPIGTALSYAIGGVVKSIDKVGRGNAGKLIEVTLDNGIVGLSMHLSEVMLEAGQRFEANQIIAKTGDTGAGPAHLHQESAAHAYKTGQAGASLAYLNIGKGNAQGARSSAVNTMQRREDKTENKAEVEQLQLLNTAQLANIAIRNGITKAIEETKTLIAQNIDIIYPVAEMQLENNLMKIRNDLQMQGMPSEYIDFKEKTTRADYEGSLALEKLKSQLKENENGLAAMQKKKAGNIALTAEEVEKYVSVSNAIDHFTGQVNENRQGLANLAVAQKAFTIASLESAIATMKNADAFKAQQETMDLIKGSVESASNSYKGFLKEVATGGDPTEALQKFQEGLTDQVLTIFLDYAFKPVEDFFKDSLSKLFNVPTEDEQRKKGQAALERQLELVKSIDTKVGAIANQTPQPGKTSNETTKNPVEATNSNANAITGGAVSGLSGQAVNQIIGGDSAAVYNNMRIPDISKMFDSIDFEAAFDPVSTSFAVTLESLSSTLNASTSELSQSAADYSANFKSVGDSASDMAKKAGETAEEAKNNGDKLKESLGKVASGIGIAAGAIMGIAAGISQVKKGGTGNTLMGIGSVLASVGGAIGGFSKLSKAANGAVWNGGFQAFANGGMVKGPTLGLVGEGKYNEAIVPLPDGRSIPVQMRGGTGGGSSRDLLAAQAQSRSSPSVLSMSFQSTTINGVEYVDRAQLEMAMAETRRVASRDGAARGANLAIDRLANSPSSRRRAGIR